jgi:hypothetical protein
MAYVGPQRHKKVGYKETYTSHETQKFETFLKMAYVWKNSINFPSPLTLSLLMTHICGVSKKFGEWYQKTNKTGDTYK